ncbi:MAG: TRAM domain-containing protein, partial [Syntrophorhabdus sp.]
DSKLVALTKKLTGKLVTNDFNLNKVAELQGIEVLNINQLATALKPAILPGEQMNIKILKEGKEYGQGIGYLDDGTMVVVDEARKLLGRQVDVVVTSVLQTTSGRMIFGKLKELADREFHYPEEIKVEEQAR